LPEECDATDYKILQILTTNAKSPIIDIASKIRLTPKAALYRMKKLKEKGVILGFNALIDTDKLGYGFYKVDFYLNDLTKIKEMIEYAKVHSEIIAVMKTVGGPDYEIEIMTKNHVNVKAIIEEIRNRFPNTIEDYRFHRVEYTIKQVYLPGQ
jgi:DNA-binding Lrp family transcriptional regulator